MNRRTQLGIAMFLCLGPLTVPAAVFQVTNNADQSTGGTLRWAITQANLSAGADTITFALPGSTTIAPTGALPYVSDLLGGTTIDGTTQPGYAGHPLVILTGTNAGTASGLAVNTDDCVIKGLLITRFQEYGLYVLSCDDTRISGNHINSNTYSGIELYNVERTIIGGTNAVDRNVISSNGNYGIYINGAAAVSNVIQGNYIGTDATGTKKSGNRFSGILLTAPANRIGGSGPGAGNVISGNGDAGIQLSSDSGHHNIIEGNYIGVTANGNAALANVYGIRLFNAVSNTIGGPTAAGRNVISGNSSVGIEFGGASRGNDVLGNMIGTDATGTFSVSNSWSGLFLAAGNSFNRIGGSTAEAGSLISGNGGFGIMATDCTGLVIRANRIGISSNGTSLGNAFVGVELSRCPEAVVGGTNAAAGNVMAGNASGIELWQCVSNQVGFNYIGLNSAGSGVANADAGIAVNGGGAHTFNDNVVSGNGNDGIWMNGAAGCTLVRNRIGTDPAGQAARGNGRNGVWLQAGASNNTIGGRWPDEGNLISGNGDTGLRIQDETTSGNAIRGNRIGTDIAGLAAIANASLGIYMADAPLNTIGSTNAGEGNVISGNGGSAILMVLGHARSNTVIGNFIGVDAGGTHELPNNGDGISLMQGACSNRVGGAQTGAGNRIAYNNGRGIGVQDGTGNLLFNNRIYRNAAVGIDLGMEGTVTPNDALDADNGGNHLQNFPVLLMATNDGTQIRVTGYLASLASASMQLELYGSWGVDPTGYGEGEQPLGVAGPFMTGPDGMLAFTNSVATPDPPPNFVTALAHHAVLNDTSEFSQRLMLDADGDGMADGFETVYFGGYTNGSPDADADEDGSSNLEEFTADTNPQDDMSVPAIRSILITGRNFTIVSTHSPEREYQLETTTNLCMPSPWHVRSCSLTRSGTNAILRGTTETNAACYRVRSLVP